MSISSRSYVIQAGCRQTRSRHRQSPKTEGRSGYWGREEVMWSGPEGRSGTRRPIWKRVLRVVRDATTICQRVWRSWLRGGWVLELTEGTGESNELDQERQAGRVGW